MPDIITCDHCHTRLKAGPQLAGRKIRCPKCQNPIHVPAGDIADVDDLLEEETYTLAQDDPYAVPDEDPYVDSAPGRPARSSGKSRKRPVARSRVSPERAAMLRNYGITFAIIGIGSFILPYLGIQFRLVNIFGPAQTLVSCVVALAGAVCLFLSFRDNPVVAGTAAFGVVFLLGVMLMVHEFVDPNAGLRGRQPAGNRNAAAVPDIPQPERPAWVPPGGQPANPFPANPFPANPFPAQPQRGNVSLPPARVKGRATELLGGSGGAPFHLASPDSAPLRGLHYRLGRWDNRELVGRVRPIFGPGDGPQPNETSVVAKPGYAVGGMNVEADKYAAAMQLIFMRVTDDGALDPADSYTSEWIGKPSGRQTQMLAGDGTNVIGLCGRQGLILDAVGLVLAE